MKFKLLALPFMLVLLVACNGLSATQQKTITDQLANVNTQAIAAEAQLDAAIIAQQATTQPAAGQPAPTAEVLATEAKNEKALRDVKAKIEQARAAGQAIAPIVISAASGENPGPAITAAAPIAGPYGIWVTLAGIAVSLGWGIWQNASKNKAVAAGQTAVDAIQQAIAAGQIVVTSVHASATVDAAANSSPTNDRLVDVIAAAPVSSSVKAVP